MHVLFNVDASNNIISVFLRDEILKRLKAIDLTNRNIVNSINIQDRI